MRLIALAIFAGLIGVAAAVAYHGRFVVASTQTNVLILDRWTGTREACALYRFAIEHPPEVVCNSLAPPRLTLGQRRRLEGFGRG